MYWIELLQSNINLASPATPFLWSGIGLLSQKVLFYIWYNVFVPFVSKFLIELFSFLPHTTISFHLFWSLVTIQDTDKAPIAHYHWKILVHNCSAGQDGLELYQRIYKREASRIFFGCTNVNVYGSLSNLYVRFHYGISVLCSGPYCFGQRVL